MGFRDYYYFTSNIRINPGVTLTIEDGARIKMESSTSVGLNNCTIANNTNAGIYISNGNASVKNSIVYYNLNNIKMDSGTPSAVIISYSCVEGGYPGIGNISSNPLFALPSGRNSKESYKLMSTEGRWTREAWVTDS